MIRSEIEKIIQSVTSNYSSPTDRRFIKPQLMERLSGKSERNRSNVSGVPEGKDLQPPTERHNLQTPQNTGQAFSPELRMTCQQPSIKHKSGDKRNKTKLGSGLEAHLSNSRVEPIFEKKGTQEEANVSLEKDERNPACEEVVMLKERGVQDQHNQTVDDAYYQDPDCPLKCNVVTNQYNFLNSIIYRNKVDLNDSPKEEKKGNGQAKQERISFQEEKDSWIEDLGEARDNEEIKSLLQELFPNYHLHYCADRSTWNPLKGTPSSLNVWNNDSFDLSINSLDYKNVAPNNETTSS